MYLEELNKKTVLLFGKSRAFDAETFKTQLQAHNINLTTDFNDEVALIIEGRMINPLEQEKLERHYKIKQTPIVRLEQFEKLLSQTIKAETLLMSLKLSGDQSRLLGFLTNPYIDNALFLRLLKLYDWQHEGFFDRDDNRNVTAALIERFYENIERNHNVQYANMGIMHLLTQTRDTTLVQSISSLEPIQTALREGSDRSTYKILREIAHHEQTPPRIQKQFIHYGDNALRAIIAQRDESTAALQKALLDLNKETINLTLACNANLYDSIAEELYTHEVYRPYLAANKRMDSIWFERLANFPETLAANETLTQTMQLQLLKTGDESVWVALASNASLRIADALHQKMQASVDSALALNKATPPELLKIFAKDMHLHSALAANSNVATSTLLVLGKSSDITVLSALAQNPSTPIELLYQFQLDRRLERFVMSNPRFSEHIQLQNIGWL